MKHTRNYKGKSLFAFPESYTVIDIETTGFSPYDDEIIEISAIKMPSGETFSTLVKPEKPITTKISSLTNITNDMVKDAPEIDEAIWNFFSFVGNDILVGHNVNFDVNFLYDKLMENYRITLQNDFVDTCKISRRLLPQLKNHKLATVAEFFGVYSPTHRALDDVKATRDCLESMKHMADREYGSAAYFATLCG